MGLLLDGILGPFLEFIGAIEIGENGEWKRVEKPKGNYDKDERPKKQKKEKPSKTNSEASQVAEKTRLVVKEPEPDKSKIYILKLISKLEGKTLLSNGYKLWYGDGLPKNDELKPGVVYVVEGKGEYVSSSPIFSGVRYDAYYIAEEVKPQGLVRTPLLYETKKKEIQKDSIIDQFI